MREEFDRCQSIREVLDLGKPKKVIKRKLEVPTLIYPKNPYGISLTAFSIAS